MKHLYEINEGSELFAADTEDQARAHYEEVVGEPPDYVKQRDDTETRGEAGRTFAVIAAEYPEPTHVFTEYT